MTLHPAVSSHHTVWVHREGSRPAPERYAVDGDRLVCFGDRALSGIPDGARVWASVHEIAGGVALASFGAVAHRLAADAVPDAALAELLDHVGLGRTPTEIATALDAHRHRRVLELVP